MNAYEKIHTELIRAKTLIDIASFDEGVKMEEVERIKADIDAALKTPPRNCDVGTAEEQMERLFSGMDDKGVEIGMKFVREVASEVLAWAQMPYKEGGAE